MDYLRPAEFANPTFSGHNRYFDVMNLFRVDRFIFVPKCSINIDAHIECVDIKINVVRSHPKSKPDNDEPAHEFYSPSTIVILGVNVPSAGANATIILVVAEKH
jgi:hypothetical protein